MDDFTRRAVGIIRAVPSGRVVSYGQVAAMAGDPRGARQVVRILTTLSDKERLPWHRVVNASGRISLPGEGGNHQRRRLEDEGVEFDETGAINLNRCQWRGPSTQ